MLSKVRNPTQEQRADAVARSQSMCSQRDIQRCFKLFAHFVSSLASRYEDAEERERRAVLLSIAVVYYMRLDARFRIDFASEIHRTDGGLEVLLSLQGFK